MYRQMTDKEINYILASFKESLVDL